MEITVLQENILTTIQNAQRFIASKPQLPILSGVYLQATEGNLTIRSTDLKVGFQTSVGGKVTTEGECVCSAKPFSELLATLAAGPVTLKLEGDTLHVHSGKVKSKLQTFPPLDFPPFPTQGERQLAIPTTEFLGLLERVLYAAGIDETRPILASILFTFAEGVLTTVATDGYRLSVNSLKVPSQSESLKFMVPAKTVQEICRTLGHSKADTVGVGVTTELLQANFSFGDTALFSRLTEGEYPPYPNIIPSSFTIEALLDVKEVMTALKTSLVFAREASSIVTLVLKDKECVIQSASSGIGENEVSTESSYTGEEQTISFNAKFLMDVLSRIESQKVLFKMNDPLKPTVFVDEDNPDAISVVMPFKR